MAEIDRALMKRAADSPKATLDVIVTLERMLDNDELAAAGLNVAQRIERLRTVSGSITAAGLERLGKLPGVVRIEADTPMRAL